MKLKRKLTTLMLVSIMTAVGSVAMSSALSINEVQYIKGADRYATASAIAGEMGNFETVILVNADKNKLADGLSASGLSGVLKAPILLVSKDSIPNETQLRLEIAKKIYIIGSENSISKNIENKLKDPNQGGFQVKRIGGADRFETSSNVANEILAIKGNIGKVFIANGYKGEADAMSISSVAARDGEPILLTNGYNIDNTTASIVEQTKNVFAIGGKNSITPGLVGTVGATRISGNDRFMTNAEVIKTFYKETPSHYYLSDGYKLVDALTGGPLAGRNLSPIVLVNSYSNKSILSGATNITAIGGINSSVINSVVAAANK